MVSPFYRMNRGNTKANEPEPGPEGKTAFGQIPRKRINFPNNPPLTQVG